MQFYELSLKKSGHDSSQQMYKIWLKYFFALKQPFPKIYNVKNKKIK